MRGLAGPGFSYGPSRGGREEFLQPAGGAFGLRGFAERPGVIAVDGVGGGVVGAPPYFFRGVLDLLDGGHGAGFHLRRPFRSGRLPARPGFTAGCGAVVRARSRRPCPLPPHRHWHRAPPRPVLASSLLKRQDGLHAAVLIRSSAETSASAVTAVTTRSFLGYRPGSSRRGRPSTRGAGMAARRVSVRAREHWPGLVLPDCPYLLGVRAGSRALLHGCPNCPRAARGSSCGAG